MYFISNNIYRRLRDFLNSKKQEIKDGKFIPIRTNIILENEIFKNIEKKYFQEIVRKWLRKNTKFKTLVELKDYYLEGNLPDLLKKFLLSKKESIIKRDFIPSLENVSLKLPKIKAMKRQKFYNIVRWWLQCNTPYKTITDIKEKKFGYSMFPALQKHLENRKSDILNGKYFPNIANLRKFNKDFNYKGSIDVVNIWLKKVSKSKFKSIKDLINQFNPSPILLGYTERDFTTGLDGLFTHIKNFVKILGKREELFDNAIQMYKDIIKSIPPKGNRNSFDIFYESIIKKKKEILTRVGHGSPKYIAGLLIYYSLIYYYEKDHRIYFLEELRKIFNLGSGTLRKRSRIISDYLKKIPKYGKLMEKIIKYRRPALKEQLFEAYPFRQNKVFITKIQNKILKNCLRNYLNQIQEGKFPMELFLNPENRASDLKFRGTNQIRLPTHLIEGYFGKRKLIKKIHRGDDLYYICEETKKIYEGRISLGKETHPLVQNHILNIHYKDDLKIKPIAMEVPVWKKFKNSDEFLTGHIDLLFVKDDMLIVADLKPKGKSEIFTSIPQIMAYGIMIRNRLKDFGNTKSFKIKCVGFYKKGAWSFDPEDIEREIIDFLMYEKQRSKREKFIESHETIAKFITF